MHPKADLRAPFPFLAECVYLDTAAAGLSSPGQGMAVAEFFDHVKTRGILGRETWRKKLSDLQQRLARMFDIAVDDVLLFSNTSEGINLVAHSLDWHAGDNLLVAEDEYPTVSQAWHIAERQSAEIIRIPISNEHNRESELLAAMNVRTRVMALSQVHWVTGTTIDLKRVGDACRANGTLLVVDGVQAWGAVPIDLSSVDVYSAAVFKWILSGFGLAICIVSARARAQLDSAYRGAMNLTAPHHLQYSHMNYPGIYALDAALDFLDGCGWDRIHAQVGALSKYLYKELSDRGFVVAAPLDALAGIISFAVPDPAALCQQLERRGIKVTGRAGRIRASPHFYNNQHDLDRLVEAVCDLSRPA